MTNSIYTMAKTLIEAGRYEKEDMTKKLDAFLAHGSITQEEYDELIALMEVGA